MLQSNCVYRKSILLHFGTASVPDFQNKFQIAKVGYEITQVKSFLEVFLGKMLFFGNFECPEILNFDLFSYSNCPQNTTDKILNTN